MTCRTQPGLTAMFPTLLRRSPLQSGASFLRSTSGKPASGSTPPLGSFSRSCTRCISRSASHSRSEIGSSSKSTFGSTSARTLLCSASASWRHKRDSTSTKFASPPSWLCRRATFACLTTCSLDVGSYLKTEMKLYPCDTRRTFSVAISSAYLSWLYSTWGTTSIVRLTFTVSSAALNTFSSFATCATTWLLIWTSKKQL